MEKEGNKKGALSMVVALLVLAALALFFAYRKGYFPTETKKVEVKVEVPVSPKLPPTAPLAPPTPDSAPSEPAPPLPKGP